MKKASVLLVAALLLSGNAFSEEGSSLRAFEKEAVGQGQKFPQVENKNSGEQKTETKRGSVTVTETKSVVYGSSLDGGDEICEADSIGAALACVVFEPLFKFVISAPFSIPRTYIGAPENDRLYFESYPFYTSKLPLVRQGARWWAWSAEGTHQWAHHNVQGNRETVNVRWAGGWGGRVSRVDYTERTGWGHESLAFNEALGFYNFAQNRSTYFRVGTGLETLEGRHHRAGAKILYGLGTGGKPFQAGLEGSLTGGMGGAPLVEATYHAAFHVGRAAFLLKYHYLAVQNVEIQGPEIGFQWWL